MSQVCVSLYGMRKEKEELMADVETDERPFWLDRLAWTLALPCIVNLTAYTT